MPPRKMNSAPVLRLGNRWLTGEGVNRIVPLYVLHRFLEPNAVPSVNAFAAQVLVKNPVRALSELKCKAQIDGASEQWLSLAEGLLNPDGRVFTKLEPIGVTAHREGAVFPVLGGLVRKASDDGLGDNLRELMDNFSPDWKGPVRSLLFPDPSHLDAASTFIAELYGSDLGKWRVSDLAPARSLSQQETFGCKFISNLIREVSGAERLTVLRELAHGIYLVALLRMVQSPVEAGGGTSKLVIFGGLPPGFLGDPIVRCACDSFQQWIRASYLATVAAFETEIKANAVPSTVPAGEQFQEQILAAMHDQFSDKEKTVLRENIAGSPSAKDVFKSLGFDARELARRIRSLGGNIGFLGPDRGIGDPRGFLDTPLLSVLVRGLAGDSALDYEEFVQRLGDELGLVVGPGNDGRLATQVSSQRSGGDLYSLLVDNQECLRLRLLRTGLARSYSDSHTEVFAVA